MVLAFLSYLQSLPVLQHIDLSFSPSCFFQLVTVAADMSTIEVSMTNPADEQTHSESELAIIGDMTVWYQMPYLSARRLIQLNSKRWPIWSPYHIKRISEARRLDDTRDWYFPIIVKKNPWIKMQRTSTDNSPPKVSPSNPLSWSWTWSGTWHSTTHHASERVHTLPPMTYLPHEWVPSSCPCCHIIGSAGGLLLIKSRQLDPLALLPDSNPTPVSDTSTPVSTRTLWPPNMENMGLRWTRLLVCNPLTRECRELPAANCRLMGWHAWDALWSWGVQAHMVVDDEANCYQVILTFEDFVAVHKSTTNSWNALHFPTPRPWAAHHQDRGYPWYYCSSTQVRGRHYFAHVQFDPRDNAFGDAICKATTAGALQLIEVDVEAGRWHLLHKYILRKYHVPFLDPNPQRFWFNMGILRNLELVGCMGDLYAVIPARLHDVVTVGQKQTCPSNLESPDCTEVGEKLDYLVEYMPVVFYVMQLQGDGVDHAVLRIPVPLTRSANDIESRKRRLYERTDPYQSVRGGNYQK